MSAKWRVERMPGHTYAYRAVGEPFETEADARAAVEAHNAGGEPVAWQWRLNGNRDGLTSRWHDCSECQAKIYSGNHACDVRLLYTAPQPAAEAWRSDLANAPVTEHGAYPTYVLITNGKHVGVGFRQLSDDPDDYEWQDESTEYVPDVIAWCPLPTPPGANPPAPAVDAVAIVDPYEAKLREAYGDDWRRVLWEAVNGAALRGEAR